MWSEVFYKVQQTPLLMVTLWILKSSSGAMDAVCLFCYGVLPAQRTTRKPGPNAMILAAKTFFLFLQAQEKYFSVLVEVEER